MHDMLYCASCCDEKIQLLSALFLPVKSSDSYMKYRLFFWILTIAEVAFIRLITEKITR
jgi:hypothetical protein